MYPVGRNLAAPDGLSKHQMETENSKSRRLPIVLRAIREAMMGLCERGLVEQYDQELEDEPLELRARLVSKLLGTLYVLQESSNISHIHTPFHQHAF